VKNSWLSVLRDVAIVMVLTFFGGFVIGIASAGRELSISAIAVSNLLFGTIGFFIAGCLTRHEGWKHLFLVTALVWLCSLVNVIFFHVAIQQWAAAIIFIFMTMAIGGGVSFLFVRPTPPTV
jgi:hypothetical protein